MAHTAAAAIRGREGGLELSFSAAAAAAAIIIAIRSTRTKTTTTIEKLNGPLSMQTRATAAAAAALNHAEIFLSLSFGPGCKCLSRDECNLLLRLLLLLVMSWGVKLFLNTGQPRGSSRRRLGRWARCCLLYVFSVKKETWALLLEIGSEMKTTKLKGGQNNPHKPPPLSSVHKIDGRINE